MVKNPPAVWETWVRSLDWEDPWKRERLSTPVFLPGESQGQRSLVGWQRVGHDSATNTQHAIATLLELHQHIIKYDFLIQGSETL